MLKETKDFFLGGFDGFFLAIGNRFRLYRIAVVVVENEYIIVAACGWDNEAASLVRSNVAGNGAVVSVDIIGALA